MNSLWRHDHIRQWRKKKKVENLHANSVCVCVRVHCWHDETRQVFAHHWLAVLVLVSRFVCNAQRSQIRNSDFTYRNATICGVRHCTHRFVFTDLCVFTAFIRNIISFSINLFLNGFDFVRWPFCRVFCMEKSIAIHQRLWHTWLMPSGYDAKYIRETFSLCSDWGDGNISIGGGTQKRWPGKISVCFNTSLLSAAASTRHIRHRQWRIFFARRRRKNIERTRELKLIKHTNVIACHFHLQLLTENE